MTVRIVHIARHVARIFLSLVTAGCEAQSGETSRPLEHPVTFAPVASVVTAATVHKAETTSHIKASPDCFGDWRFTIGAFSELEVSPQQKDSWCRSLPRDLAVELRKQASGRPSVTGVPLQPTDVLAGSGTCEFQFDGPTKGVPANYSLTIEVPNDASVDGRAKCTAWETNERGRRTGWGMTAPTKVLLTAIK
jgi:hypothetical protein